MVKTLNVRGLNDYSSEICNFLQEIESSFLDVINTYQEPKCQMVEAEKVKNTIEVLGECFAAGTAPADSFHCFSCGSFKEAYHASDDIVMKFCSCENDTEAEAALLNDAAEAGFEDLFVPTYFHKLPIPMAIHVLDDTNSERYYYDSYKQTWVHNPECGDFELTYMEIQPLVTPASTISCTILPWDYKEETVLGIPTETVRDVGIYNLNWLEAFVNVYGAERFMKFADFCGEHLIRDLHDGNIGFMRKGEVEIPIILDWLSD